ncbi:helix-turn-helix domain-containing protein [Parathalassolituus penaei]|uniref:Helix-turn-helix domain-containing protein n=1 Tax=Parathalassolituus penaei TaxID=2997323 RepID=A0A9X3EBA6_9GAMM|nr:helix-turn-helix transcriptional regulator [Parathalassolituus penaei]MCY0964080.1 helix-turn-helix domain-containing protein [Parathalassolituus penaei]
MDKPNFATLGQNLQSLRVSRGLSLSQLANDAGIAKSNLSRIEQGEGNPTIETIWRLAMQLKVPFGDLIARADIALGENGVQVRLIDQGNDNPRVDVYWMSCAPHSLRESEPHFEGTVESVTMISGEVLAGNTNAPKTLRAGDTFSFDASQPHSYRTGELWATMVVVVTYPKTTRENLASHII